MFNNAGYDSAAANAHIRIKEGLVLSVNSESQTMVVDTDLGILKDIPINNPVGLNGSGMRVMPIANITRVILYIQGKYAYHLGTSYMDRDAKGLNISLKNCTNDPFYSKEIVKDILYMRNLISGECQLQGPNNNEFYADAEGNIIIANAIGCSIRLDIDLGLNIHSCESNIIEANEVLINSGVAIRNTEPKSNRYEPYYITGSQAKAESNILKVESIYNPVIEHRIVVGYEVDESLGIQLPFSPISVATWMCANISLDNKGEAIQQDNLDLNHVFDFHETGLRMFVDVNGRYGITNIRENIPEQYVHFYTGDLPFLDIKVDKTSLALTADSLFELKSTGYTYTVQESGEKSYIIPGVLHVITKSDGTHTVEIFKDDEVVVGVNMAPTGNITVNTSEGLDIVSKNIKVTASDALEILAGDVASQKSVLGEALVELLLKFIEAVKAHTHPVDVSNSIANASVDFLAFASQNNPQVIQENLMSKKFKHN